MSKMNTDMFHKLKICIHNRDNNKCVSCGRDYYLQIHHIKKRSNGGDDNPNNLVTLCWDCHETIHSTKKRNKLKKIQINISKHMEGLNDKI